MNSSPSVTRPVVHVCDICTHVIEPGERFTDDGDEITHDSCSADWFRRNFGREGLS